MKRRMFDKGYLKQEFEKLSITTKRSLTIYLIGGGAMAFYGLKNATKDVDIILTNQEDAAQLKTVLEELGYQEPDHLVIVRAYKKMQTSVILENKDGFRWDLFLNKVCNALTLSDEMKKRSTSIYEGDCLKVSAVSKEDLFLFKGITEREADLEDMAMLARSGLDWGVISEECKSQSEASEVCWEDGLYQNLLDLKSKYDIVSPIEKPLRRAAEKKIIESMLLKQIENGNSTVKGIARQIGEPQSLVRAELKQLEGKGLIRINRSAKTHKFFLDKKVFPTKRRRMKKPEMNF